MTSENTSRWGVLAGLLVVLLVALYHRLRSITKERLDRTQEGWFILIALRLAGLATMAKHRDLPCESARDRVGVGATARMAAVDRSRTPGRVRVTP